MAALSFSNRVRVRAVPALLAMGLLAACERPAGYTPPPGLPSVSLETTGALPPPSRPGVPSTGLARGEVIGTGPVRIALLLPMTGAGDVGKQMADAARLAMNDFPNSGLQLTVKDTQGKPDATRVVTREALDEGAQLLLGPLFARNVDAASFVARPANIPVLAFSSDTSRARPGVYLNSFAPQADVRRTMSYALSQGQTRIVALLPEGSYGDLVLRELSAALPGFSGNLTHVSRYKRAGPSLVKAARDAVLPLNAADAIYIPEGGEVPAILLEALRDGGAELDGKQVIGSGQWKSLKSDNPLLEGALFAGNDDGNFRPFQNRYRVAFNADPPVPAGLVYDAVVMASELVRRDRATPFLPGLIETPGGFNGVTGLFRFNSQGSSERGLSIYQVQGGAFQVVSPAPGYFKARS